MADDRVSSQRRAASSRPSSAGRGVGLLAAAAVAAAAVRLARDSWRPEGRGAAVAPDPTRAGPAPGADARGPVPLPRTEGNVLDRIVIALDRVQRRFRPAAFGFGVAKKFGEDGAGRLAALVAYYSFFSIFPLLLVLVTILGMVLTPDLQKDIVDSAFGQIPVVGDDLEQGTLTGSGVTLAVGLLGALWAGTGALIAAQNAMNEVWDVPHAERPNFLQTRARALAMLGVLGLGLVATTGVNALPQVLDLRSDGQLAIYAGSFLLNVIVVSAAYQVLTDKTLSPGEVLPGATVGAIGYFLLQLFGAIVIRRFTDASDTYGSFGVVLGLLTWFFLLAQFLVIGAEINVVRTRHLWPRSLSGRALTPADHVVEDRFGREARRRAPVP